MEITKVIKDTRVCLKLESLEKTRIVVKKLIDYVAEVKVKYNNTIVNLTLQDDNMDSFLKRKEDFLTEISDTVKSILSPDYKGMQELRKSAAFRGFSKIEKLHISASTESVPTHYASSAHEDSDKQADKVQETSIYSVSQKDMAELYGRIGIWTFCAVDPKFREHVYSRVMDRIQNDFSEDHGFIIRDNWLCMFVNQESDVYYKAIDIVKCVLKDL